MKIHDSFLVAFDNIKNRKKTSLKVIISIAFAISLIITGLTYLFMTENSIKKLINADNYSTELSFKCWYGEQKNSPVFDAYDKTIVSELLKIEGVRDVVVNSEQNLYEFYEKQARNFLTYNDITLLIEGENTFESDNVNELFMADFITTDTNQIAPSRMDIYKRQNNNDNIFLYGTQISNENQIVISENILSFFKVEESTYSNLIGKKISFIDKIDNKTVFKNLELCGIIKAGFFTSEENNNTSQIISHMNNNFMSSEFEVDVRVYLDDIKYLKSTLTLLEKKKNQTIFYDEGTMAVFETLEQQANLTKSLLLVFGSIIIIAILVLVIHTFSYYLKKKQHYYGLIKALGSSNLGIFRLFLCEFLLLGVFSIIISLIVSFGLTNIINELVYFTEDFIMEFSVSIFFNCFFSASIITLIMSFFLALFFSVKTNFKTASELLLS